MRILILTSKDHPYGNIVLGQLFAGNVLDGHQVTVWEQDSIVPGKGKFDGLRKYLTIAGARYVWYQAAKQCFFLLARFTATVSGNKKSLWYPYEKRARVQMTRETVNGIKSDAVRNEVQALHVDVLLSLFSKEIIPSSILALPTIGSVNLHPAPLPYFRGVSPTFWVLKERQKTTGVTLHILDAGIDTGRILGQTLVPAGQYTCEHELYVRLALGGATLVTRWLSAIKRASKRAMVGIIQREKGSYFSMPTRDAVDTFLRDGHVFFHLRDFM
ncbi:hypothetical protein HY409_01405 [Candidatus Gottesmanbacteria bacterium]|nr:hypothetical protein [Candidatus Gottesmanbacteria bacterium]